MSENESAGEKTEQPTENACATPANRATCRARELGTAAVFGAGVLAVMAMSGSIGRGATAWMEQALSPEQSLQNQGTVRPLRRPAAAVHAGDRAAGAGLHAGQLRRPLVMGGLRWSAKR